MEDLCAKYEEKRKKLLDNIDNDEAPRPAASRIGLRMEGKGKRNSSRADDNKKGERSTAGNRKKGERSSDAGVEEQNRIRIAETQRPATAGIA